MNHTIVTQSYAEHILSYLLPRWFILFIFCSIQLHKYQSSGDALSFSFPPDHRIRFKIKRYYYIFSITITTTTTSIHGTIGYRIVILRRQNYQSIARSRYGCCWTAWIYCITLLLDNWHSSLEVSSQSNSQWSKSQHNYRIIFLKYKANYSPLSNRHTPNNIIIRKQAKTFNTHVIYFSYKYDH